MNTFRTLTAVGAVALAAAVLTPATAHAGGGPDFSTVTVDRTAALTGDVATVTGTYSCTAPGPSTLGLQLLTRYAPPTEIASREATCDGITRTWAVAVPAEGLRAGSAHVNGYVEGCLPDGCPMNLFEAQISLVPRR